MTDNGENFEIYDLSTLAALFAVDALEGDDLRRFENFLDTNPEALSEVMEYHETTAKLASLSATEPPAHLRGAVLSQLEGVRQEPIGLPVRRESQRPLRTALLAVAAALLLVVGGFVGYSVRSPANTGEMASVLSAKDIRVTQMTGTTEASAGLVYSVSEGRALVLGHGLPRVPKDKVYQLWRIRGDKPAPAGFINPSGSSTVNAGIASGDTVAVTVEPSTGSDSPTSPVILSAEI